jgi:hypothetical protein
MSLGVGLWSVGLTDPGAQRNCKIEKRTPGHTRPRLTLGFVGSWSRILHHTFQTICASRKGRRVPRRERIRDPNGTPGLKKKAIHQKLRWILEPEPDSRIPAPGSQHPIFALCLNGFSGSLFASVTTVLWSSRIPVPIDPGAKNLRRQFQSAKFEVVLLLFRFNLFAC